MRILGIDPGKATTGFGIIEANGKATYTLVHMGLVETPKEMDHGQRLRQIYDQMAQILSDFTPEVVAIERLFFATNALTAIDVGQAIGVIKLAVYDYHVPIFDYAPMQIKLMIGGSGRADKKVMKTTIKKMFKLREKRGMRTHFDNTADALAVAVCHARKVQANGIVK